MTIYLAGNPNCGKSTLFNILCRSDARTGNYPGVTVKVTSGKLRRGPGVSTGSPDTVGDVTVTDLPGTYSLDTASPEEAAARQALTEARNSNKITDGDVGNAVVAVADATALPRALYLVTELTELGLPTILALTMTDELSASGGSVDICALSSMIGIPVLIAPNGSRDKSAADRFAGDVLRHLLRATTAKVRAGFPRVKLHDGDINARYRFIDSVCRRAWHGGNDSGTDRRYLPDRFFLGRQTAYPAFAAVAALIFALTFGLGGAICRIFEKIPGAAAEAASAHLASLGAPPMLISFITDGLMTGVSGVLGYLPIIIILFTCLDMLEDCGYMARAAFLFDRPLRAAGLSGRSFVPLIMGFGCTVPALGATRTLGSGRDRHLTLMLLPYMSCTAKIPVYALFCSVFFPGRFLPPIVIALLYATGIAVAVGVSALARRFAASLDGPSDIFMLELPPWRAPRPLHVLRSALGRTGEFLRKTFTVIIASSAAVWFLSDFTPSFAPATGVTDSMLALLGRGLSPLLYPFGITHREQAAAALLTGLLAKEAVISSLAVGTGGLSSLPLIFTPSSAGAYMTFVLLYPPCIAASSSLASELSSRRRALAFLGCQTAIAYAAALAVGWLLRLLGMP